MLQTHTKYVILIAFTWQKVVTPTRFNVMLVAGRALGRNKWLSNDVTVSFQLRRPLPLQEAC